MQRADLQYLARGRSRNHSNKFVRNFNRLGIHFKALDLGVGSTTPAGKTVLQVFAALAEYDQESVLCNNRIYL